MLKVNVEPKGKWYKSRYGPLPCVPIELGFTMCDGRLIGG